MFLKNVLPKKMRAEMVPRHSTPALTATIAAVLNINSKVHSTQYTVNSTQYTVHSTQALTATLAAVLNINSKVHSTQYTVHSTQHTVVKSIEYSRITRA